MATQVFTRAQLIEQLQNFPEDSLFLRPDFGLLEAHSSKSIKRNPNPHFKASLLFAPELFRNPGVVDPLNHLIPLCLFHVKSEHSSDYNHEILAKVEGLSSVIDSWGTSGLIGKPSE